MTVGEITPNTDATPNDWTNTTGSPRCDQINEDRTSPSTATYVEAIGADNNEYEAFGFTTLDNIENNSITQVKVWTYARTPMDTPEIAISWNGGSSYSAYVETTWTYLNAWYSNTWSGLSYSKADLDQFQVSFRADTPLSFNLNRLSCMYVEVTYTESASGYTHKFCGVLPANIGKISGVATANIGKVKGV